MTYTFPCDDAACHGPSHRPYSRSKIPSVTGIVGVQDKGMPFAWSASKIASTYWSNHHVELSRMEPDAAIDKGRKAFSAEWAGSALVGTLIHNCGEAFFRGEEWAPPEDLSDDVEARIGGYVEGLYAFFEDMAPTALATEQVVRGTTASGIGYVGTFDWLVEIGGDVWMLDLKTGKPRDDFYTNEWRAQLHAYAAADTLCHFHGTKEVATLPLWETLPRPERYGIIKMTGQSDYALIEVDAGESVADSFDALAKVQAWMKTGHASPPAFIMTERKAPEPELIVFEPRPNAPVDVESMLG